MKFNKLVRDKIPEIIEGKNKVPVTKILNLKEYKEALNKKLQEEVDEFLESGEIEELADIIEVIYAITGTKESTIEEVEKVRQQKKKERGGFDQKILLIETKE